MKIPHRQGIFLFAQIQGRALFYKARPCSHLIARDFCGIIDSLLKKGDKWKVAKKVTSNPSTKKNASGTMEELLAKTGRLKVPKKGDKIKGVVTDISKTWKMISKNMYQKASKVVLHLRVT